ncbi:hypothetical protein BaRGS_00003829 [Batillaria attramentaria]|uniref:Serine-threonine/tyrosine-protein kinase catalytic domain-containing protein n=1 Tax=Batillaria attramentaria TaxID=370345 RepID=A0ABD0LZX9_9CAEN
MWGLFSRDPTKDFNYEVGEKVPGLEDKSLWTLHYGKKKGSGEPVSVFAFDVKAASELQVQTAKAAAKRLRTLRHPNILTFLDSVETDKVIYVATEAVVPLETYLQNNSDSHNETAISWGLHQILKGLSFLVNDCNLIHNNVCMSSVFVDAAGEWKLGGVDYMYPAQGQTASHLSKSCPRYRNTTHRKRWRMSRFKATSVFNGNLPRTASLKTIGKVPKKLVPSYCELVSANPKSRPNPGAFLQECRKKGGFLNNSFVESMLFLEEIQIKDQAEKNKFFASLTPSLDSFPPQMCRNKILPQLLNAFEYGNAGSSILPPMFKIGKHLDTDEYQRKIVPCVVKLFSSPDRSTRVNLLQQIEFFVEHLSHSVVNDQIFPNISSGFMDTNPVVREATVKAMLHLAGKLNYKNLNEELMKHFARLQSKDDQGGIRTNTTVCLGKIACNLNPAIRQKILISAFLRALKDPFPPARQAGILAMAATQNYYHMGEVANRLLPALCSMTRDPEKTVRDQAFKAIHGFLDKLEKLSENPDLQEEMEREVMTGGSATAMSPAGWAGWAVTGMSSLTSKFYSKGSRAKPTPPAGMGPQSTAPTPKPSSEEARPASFAKEPTRDLPSSRDFSPTETSAPQKLAGSGGGGMADTDGWGNDDDDWGSLDDVPDQKKDSGPQASSRRPGAELSSWGEEDFAPADSSLTSASQYNWGGGGEDDFFSSVIKPDKPQSKSSRPTPPRSTSSRSTPSRDSPARSTASSASSTTRERPKAESLGGASGGGLGETGGGGWGDDEDWGSMDTGISGESEADRKKREREEKRLQRQKELQEKREARKGGGAMKLGAKKIG